MEHSGRIEKLYKGGEESVFSKKRIEARETLIREIAEVFAEEFKLKNRTSGSIEDIVRDLREKLPLDSKLKSDKKTFELSCKRIGQIFNSYFGNDFIDLNSGRICEDISDKLYSLTVQINGEYFEVLKNTGTLIKNIYTVIEALKNNFNTFSKNIKNPRAKDFHEESIKILEQLAGNLKVMIGQKIDSDFLSEVKNSEVIKKYFKKFTSKYNEGLAKIFDTTYNFTSVLAKINKLCSKLGITIDQIRTIANSSNPAQELSKKVYESIKDVKDNEFDEYLKSYNELTNILSNKELNIALRQPVIGNNEIIGSSDNYNLKNIQKKSGKKHEAMIRLFIDNFNYKFSEIKTLLMFFIKEIGENKYKDVPISNLSNSICDLNPINSSKQYLQYCGAENDSTAIQARAQFIYECETIIQDFTELNKAVNSETVSKLVAKFTEIINLIEESVKNFNNVFIKLGSGIKGVIDKINNVIGKTSNVINSVNDSLQKKGSNMARYLSRIVPESIGEFDNVKNLLLFTIRKNQMLTRMKALSVDKVSDDEFIELNAKSIAKIKDELTKKLNSVIEKVTLERNVWKSDPYVIKIHKDNTKEDITTLLTEQYNAYWDLLEIAEALDIHYKSFFENILEKPEEISSLLSDLTSEIALSNTGEVKDVDVYKTFAEKTGKIDVEGILSERLKAVREISDKNGELRSLVKIFSKITENIDKNSFKSPMQIFEVIINFLSCYNIFTKDGNNLKITNSVFSKKADKTIFDDTIEGTSLLFNIINSMIGKISVAVDTYILLNKPFPSTYGYRLSTARLVLGGNEEFVIDPKLLEIYIRVPLLVKFYKKFFKDYIFEEPSVPFAPKNDVLYPELRFEGPLKQFYQICFKESHSEKDIKYIVGVCNNLYMNNKNDPDPLLGILNYVIKDINSKIGLMTFDKIKNEKTNYDLNSGLLLSNENEEIRSAPSNNYVSSIKYVKDKDKNFVSNYKTKLVVEIKDVINRLRDKMKEIYKDNDKYKVSGEKTINFSKKIKNYTERFKKLSENEKMSFLIKILNEDDISISNLSDNIYNYHFNKMPQALYKNYSTMFTNLNERIGNICDEFISTDWSTKKTLDFFKNFNIMNHDFFINSFSSNLTTTTKNISDSLEKHLPAFSNLIKKILFSKSRGEKIEVLLNLYPDNKKLIKYIYNTDIKYGSGSKKKNIIVGGSRIFTVLDTSIIPDIEKNTECAFRADYIHAKGSAIKIISDLFRIYLHYEIGGLNEFKSIFGDTYNVFLEPLAKLIKIPITSDNPYLDQGHMLSLSNVINTTGDKKINDYFMVRGSHGVKIEGNLVDIAKNIFQIIKTSESIKNLGFYKDLFVSGFESDPNTITGDLGTTFDFRYLLHLNLEGTPYNICNKYIQKYFNLLLKLKDDDESVQKIKATRDKLLENMDNLKKSQKNLKNFENLNKNIDGLIPENETDFNEKFNHLENRALESNMGLKNYVIELNRQLSTIGDSINNAGLNVSQFNVEIDSEIGKIFNKFIAPNQDMIDIFNSAKLNGFKDILFKLSNSGTLDFYGEKYDLNFTRGKIVDIAKKSFLNPSAYDKINKGDLQNKINIEVVKTQIEKIEETLIEEQRGEFNYVTYLENNRGEIMKELTILSTLINYFKDINKFLISLHHTVFKINLSNIIFDAKDPKFVTMVNGNNTLKFLKNNNEILSILKNAFEAFIKIENDGKITNVLIGPGEALLKNLIDGKSVEETLNWGDVVSFKKNIYELIGDLLENELFKIDRGTDCSNIMSKLESIGSFNKDGDYKAYNDFCNNFVINEDSAVKNFASYDQLKKYPKDIFVPRFPLYFIDILLNTADTKKIDLFESRYSKVTQLFWSESGDDDLLKQYNEGYGYKHYYCHVANFNLTEFYEVGDLSSEGSIFDSNENIKPYKDLFLAITTPLKIDTKESIENTIKNISDKIFYFDKPDENFIPSITVDIDFLDKKNLPLDENIDGNIKKYVVKKSTKDNCFSAINALPDEHKMYKFKNSNNKLDIEQKQSSVYSDLFKINDDDIRALLGVITYLFAYRMEYERNNLSNELKKIKIIEGINGITPNNYYTDLKYKIAENLSFYHKYTNNFYFYRKSLGIVEYIPNLFELSTKTKFDEYVSKNYLASVANVILLGSYKKNFKFDESSMIYNTLIENTLGDGDNDYQSTYAPYFLKNFEDSKNPIPFKWIVFEQKYPFALSFNGEKNEFGDFKDFLDGAITNLEGNFKLIDSLFKKGLCTGLFVKDEIIPSIIMINMIYTTISKLFKSYDESTEFNEKLPDEVPKNKIQIIQVVNQISRKVERERVEKEKEKKSSLDGEALKLIIDGLSKAIGENSIGSALFGSVLDKVSKLEDISTTLNKVFSDEGIKIKATPKPNNQLYPFIDSIKNDVNKNSKYNEFSEEFKNLFTKVLKANDQKINNDVIDLFEYIYIHNDGVLSNVTVGKDLKFKIDLSNFIRLTQNFIVYNKKIVNLSEMIKDVASLEDSIDRINNNINKKIKDKVLGNKNATNPSLALTKYNTVSGYFTNYKINVFYVKFSKLLKDYLKTFSDKKKEVFSGNVISYRYFYSKIINPLIEESLFDEFYDKKTGNSYDSFFNTIKRSIIKYNDKKGGTKKYIEESYDLLPSFYKSKIIFNSDLYQHKFSSFLNKVIFFKDISDIYDLPASKFQKMINVCNNILNTFIELKKDINETFIMGETTKNGYKNYLNIYKVEPYYPPLGFLSLLNNPDSIKLIKAYGLVFGEKDLTEKNIISLNDILQVTTSKQITVKEALFDINYMIKIFRVLYDLDDSIKRTHYDLISVNYGGNFNSFPLCKENFNGIEVLEVLEENRKNKAIEKYHKLISIKNHAESDKINGATDFYKEINDYVKITNNNDETMNILMNILEKNIMPINLRSLFRTVLFSNILILESVLIDNMNIKTNYTGNDHSLQGIVLIHPYKEFIKTLMKNYQLSSGRKLKALELLDDRNAVTTDKNKMSYGDAHLDFYK